MHRTRRSLIVAVTAVLVFLPVLAGSPSAAARPAPTAAKLHGINLDSSTVLDLQRYMNSHRLNSVSLTAFYLA